MLSPVDVGSARNEVRQSPQHTLLSRSDRIERQLRQALSDHPPPSYARDALANRHMVSLPGRIFCSLMLAFPVIAPYGIHALPSGPTWKIDTSRVVDENEEAFIRGIATHLGIDTGGNAADQARAVLHTLRDALEIAELVSVVKYHEDHSVRHGGDGSDHGNRVDLADPATPQRAPVPGEVASALRETTADGTHPAIESAVSSGTTDSPHTPAPAAAIARPATLASENFEYIAPSQWRTELRLTASQESRLKTALNEVHVRIFRLKQTPATETTQADMETASTHLHPPATSLVLDFGGAATLGDLWQIFCSVLGGKGHVFRAADDIAAVLCELMENDDGLEIKFHGQSLGASVAEYLKLSVNAYFLQKTGAPRQGELLLFDGKQLNHTHASAALASQGGSTKREHPLLAGFLNAFPLADWARSRLCQGPQASEVNTAMRTNNGLVLSADVAADSRLSLMDVMRAIGYAHPPAILRVIVDLPQDRDWGDHIFGYHQYQAYRGCLEQMIMLIEELYPESGCSSPERLGQLSMAPSEFGMDSMLSQRTQATMPAVRPLDETPEEESRHMG